MTVPHDPLTPSQEELLQVLKTAGGIEMTTDEQHSTQRGRDMQFLMGLQMVRVAPAFLSQNPAQSRWIYTAV